MPLSLYANGFVRLASTLTQDVLGRPAARLLRHRPELRQGRPTLIIGGDVRDVTDRVHTREALHCQIGEDIQTAATAGNRSGVLRDGSNPDSPPPHTTVRAGTRASVAELDVVGMNCGNAGLKPDVRAGFGQLLEGVLVGLLGEWREQGRPAVDDGDLAGLGEPPGAR